MSLLEMSFAGGVLILAVIVLRALALNRLPKATFLILWAVAVLRLLLPFSIPSPASVYTLAERVPLPAAAPAAVVPAAAGGTFAPVSSPVIGTDAGAVPGTGAAVQVWFWV
ncbi:MAG: M56 family metallopeptidase, partial [Oscillospiraceae bacterium]|nr:M56 family metallopeptidase [Oscillospiraceae bacterium]